MSMIDRLLAPLFQEKCEGLLALYKHCNNIATQSESGEVVVHNSPLSS